MGIMVNILKKLNTAQVAYIIFGGGEVGIGIVVVVISTTVHCTR